MNGWSELHRFLRADPRDVGCAQAMEMLQSTPSWWRRALRRSSGTQAVAAHLRACGPCGGDLEGLLAAVRDGEADWPARGVPRPH